MTPIASRVKSSPELPPALQGFSFIAAIDWIEIELTLSRPSQWHHLKRRAAGVWGNVFVKSLESNESSRVFRLRVQDPVRADEFMRQVQLLARPGESLDEGTVKVVGVEIAIDAFHPCSDPETLARAALYFLKHHANLPGGLPRVAIPAYFDAPKLAAMYAVEKEAHHAARSEALRNGTEPPPPMPKKFGQQPVVGTDGDALEALRRGLTINQGKAPSDDNEGRGDSHRLRVYVKTHDTTDGVAYARLPAVQHCARSERTLLDKHVPFTSINEWRHFRFESLARRFELLVPAVRTNPLAQQLQLKVLQHGLCLDKTELPQHVDGAMATSLSATYRRTKRPGARADTAANARIRSALKCLTLRSRVKIRKEIDANGPLPAEGDDGCLGSGLKYSIGNTFLHIGRQSILTDEAPTSGQLVQVAVPAAQPQPGHDQAASTSSHHDPPTGRGS